MRSLLNALQEGRLIELPETDKEKSLRYLAHLIEAVPDLSGNPELAEMMLERERLQNTAIGLGVACPHVRVEGSGELLCAVGWSPAGVDYGAPDSKKVYLVVMYYIPDSQKGAYLKEISALAQALRREGAIEAIAKAGDIGNVRDRMLDWVQSALDAAIPESKARMIRLEAKQAAAEIVPTASPGALQALRVLIVSAAETTLALCQNAELAKTLEKDENLLTLARAGTQFEKLGYRLVFQSATTFDGRVLYEYVAVK